MKFIIFVFIFLTLFNPVSTNIALLFNIGLFFCVKSRIRINYHRDLLYPVLLLLLSLFSMARYGAFDLTMVGIYSRMLLSFILLPYIVAFFAITKYDLIEIIVFCLLLHCGMVLIQLIYPELEWINQSFFRYERDMDSLEDLSSRRLGLAGSFDVAGYYTAACSILSYIQYVSTGKKKYLLFLLLSIVSSVFTSRTGMSLGIIGVGLAFIFYGMKRTSFAARYILLVFVAAFGYLVVYPIVSGHSGSIDVNANYGDNTFLYLTTTHILPLMSISANQLIWGVGTLVSNQSSNYGWSDIGYIKQIFEVGLIGVFIMVLFCVRVFYK